MGKVALRLLGALAIRHRSEMARAMGEDRPLTDLDFVGHRKQRNEIEALFAQLGYEAHGTFNVIHGDERLMFFAPGSKVKVDLWLDIFRMSHTFDFRDRLEMDSTTLPLADLLMTKLQIVELNEKDVRDLVCLLADHELSDNDRDLEKINVTRLGGECSKNWGIYKTFTTNLNRMRNLVPKYIGDPSLEAGLLEKIDKISNSLEAVPKTLRWRIRAVLGETKPWYETPDVRR